MAQVLSSQRHFPAELWNRQTHIEPGQSRSYALLSNLPQQIVSISEYPPSKPIQQPAQGSIADRKLLQYGLDQETGDLIAIRLMRACLVTLGVVP